jgi:hypothetical protein
LGKVELVAEFLLAAGHFAVVGFVVVSGEVEQAVEDKDFQLAGEGVALSGGLAEGGFYADGEVAGVFFFVLDEVLGGEG